MRSIVAWLVIGACVAAPCGFAAERFTSDKPTPLKRLKPGKDDGNAVRFSGSVQLAGQFLMVWKRENGGTVYRQMTFYPDPGSAALLPHPADEKPAAELELANRDQAGAMLRDLVTLETPLRRGETSAAGAASVTIRNYRTGVVCDHRWYLAELVSAARQDIVVS
ncbi:MAG TPA: hypothetical protein VMQ73_18855, partial [Methylomirabilota bacterium]|nr:hypothetical protein [Methylomirabilota bacterium]